MLRLVLAFFVFVGDFALLVGLEKDYLAETFVRVNLGWQRGCIADFEGDETFPFGLEWCDIYDDPAARICGFAKADGEHIARDAEIFDGAAQRERIGRNDADSSAEIDEGARVELLGVDDGGVYVGEDVELIGDTDVVAVARYPITDHAVAHLPVFERLDHAMFQRHLSNPDIRLDRHLKTPCVTVFRNVPSAKGRAS